MNKQALPPGLHDLSVDQNLSKKRVQQLATAWGTIRGHKPQNLGEWRTFYAAVKQFLDEADNKR